MSAPQRSWLDYPLIFPMGARKTANLERATANHEPLEDTCPVHAWPVPRAATWETSEQGDVVIVTFHPCGHQGYPQWDAAQRHPSRYLSSPIARPGRRKAKR